jgi:hypothetical protein
VTSKKVVRRIFKNYLFRISTRAQFYRKMIFMHRNRFWVTKFSDTDQGKFASH